MDQVEIVKRMGMIKGARRSAKQVVEKFVNSAILKIEVCGAGTEEISKQLIVYRTIAKELGWTDIETRISRALFERERLKSV